MAVALISLAVVSLVISRLVDAELWAAAVGQMADRPLEVAVALTAFGLAFVLRAVAWRRVLPKLSFGQALAGIHLALCANHVLPLRLGEGARVMSVARRTDVSLEAATASTVTLRSADMLGVVMLGLLAGPAAFLSLVGPVGWAIFAAMGAVAVLSWRWLRSLVRRRGDVRLPGIVALGASVLAWLAESALVWSAARWAGLEMSWVEAVFVAAVAVAAQIAAIAPGGFGTYEAAAVAAYVALGYDAEVGLVAALLAHVLKTAYSLVAGAFAVFGPRPGLLGRFRLREVRTTAAPLAIDPEAPVVLFMPAYNEEASVAACVARVPERVAGRGVRTLVIDDGSTDRTAEVAAAAGAEVISFESNQGLGAAVRRGFAEAIACDAAAVVFCDADGEYAPEELEAMVAPILGGAADYVVGSRFAGDIELMRRRRRVGNVVLTKLLSVIARRRITDGQSGYRALSPAAVRAAEVVHDFNYAQVLTLDLLAKGFRYREVPISYHFRTTGESFVTLGRYLRNVGPAVYRELNTG